MRLSWNKKIITAIYKWSPLENVLPGHMLAAKFQIRPRMRAVWSGPSLSAYVIIVYCWLYLRASKKLIRQAGCACWTGPLLHALWLKKGTASNICSHLSIKYTFLYNVWFCCYCVCTLEYQFTENYLEPGWPPDHTLCHGLVKILIEV